MFYFVVPETFSYGSLGILMALIMAALSQRRVFSGFSYVFINVVTMSMTITNWMAGGLVTLVNNNFKRTFQIIVYAFFTASIVWSVQKMLFPEAKFFFDFNREARFMLLEGSGGAFYVIKAFIYHTLIMPSIYVIDKFGKPDWPLLLTQLSEPGSATAWGIPAVFLWTMLFTLGTITIFSVGSHLKFRIVLGLLILGQLGMHVIYGDETFLYSLHFIVLLVPLVALSSLTRWRTITIIFTILLIPCVYFNNSEQFKFAMDFFNYHGTEHQKLRANEHFRPGDPWPRSKGHVVLAYPGTPREYKAYYEPGGSFSPSVGSFGISIWVTDQTGHVVATSDSIPLKDIKQGFLGADQQVPGVHVQTPYYEAVWNAVHPGAWKVDLKRTKKNFQLTLVVRGVGPAGGNINTLEWEDKTLFVNGRWGVTMHDRESKPVLGDESQVNWKTHSSDVTRWQTYHGWGFARFPLQGDSWSWVINDRQFPDFDPAEYSHAGSEVKLSLPEKEFAESLNAQLAHMTMGLQGTETRPGDPMSYPSAWQREASYIVLALARAGKLELAKQLSFYLAENDFFGGRGVEADGPGLGLWVLSEVSGYLNDSEFDRLIWPHVQRKAKLIASMSSSKERILGANTGVPVPALKNKQYWWGSLVSEPAKDGLIRGKVDQQFLTFYVNAVSWAGLNNAVHFAERMNDQDSAARWGLTAGELRQAWERHYAASDERISNAYTYASALWPTTIVSHFKEIYRENLTTRWNKNRLENGGFRFGMNNSALALAETHQWLFLNDLDHLWGSLRWFWRNQSSPGLYTWSETLDDDNVYKDWEEIRGWSNLNEVTPHYGTAAEMVLLQLNMLGYLDESASRPTIVIGGGIPQEWLHSPMDVQGLSFPGRSIDWKWDGSQMWVKVHGSPVDIRLGPVFDSDTVVHVKQN